MKRAVECLTQADVDRVAANGDIAIVRSGRFEAWESSHVVARESSHVVARESSHVEAWGSSHVVAWESSHVVASPNVSVRQHSGPFDHPKIKGGILLTVPVIDTAEKWCDYYGVKVTRGIATLYKAVRDDFHSARGADYSPGAKPEAPDWDPVPECGGGLHFSFHPSSARSFDSAATRFVACPVRVSEIVVHVGGSYPNKVKAPRVVGKGCVEVDERGAVIEAAAS